MQRFDILSFQSPHHLIPGAYTSFVLFFAYRLHTLESLTNKSSAIQDPNLTKGKFLHALGGKFFNPIRRLAAVLQRVAYNSKAVPLFFRENNFG